MKPGSEKKIINLLLIVCLSLGFISLVVVYLPDKIQGQEQKIKKEPQPKRLSDLLPQRSATEAKKDVELAQGIIYSRFVPEPKPEQIQKDAETQTTQTVVVPANATVQNKVHAVSSLTNNKRPSISYQFKTPIALEPDVTFWKYIYTKYDSHQEVFHDPRYLNIIYSVLDFKHIDNNQDLTEFERQEKRKDFIEAEKERILVILKKLQQEILEDKLTAKEKHIQRLFSTISEQAKFANAIERGVRAQTGQSDKFLAGLKYSGRYLGEMETIFEIEGLPRELTRLVFVESMFNPDAHSAVGAKGFWQFMKATGKIHDLNINSLVDERADPIHSTYAATRLLKKNYEELDSWPLAINAYNAGLGRLKQARKTMGTSNITTIVRNFKHPAYGFASRDFYMEFLAALEIVENYEKYFGKIAFDQPLRYDVIKLNRPILLKQLSQDCNVPSEQIAEFNPGLRDNVIYGTKHLPAYYELKLPEKTGNACLTQAYNAPTVTQLWHVVENGETVKDIARLYGLSQERLLEINNHLNKHKQLRPGQKIKIY
ncbi:MAG: transglycosylase SLT domain-containing protein [Pseudomonadota bacterium]